jgi:diaminopimelate decarboxylase
MEEFRYIGRQLTAEETPLRDVAEQFGTPVYVYSMHSILDHCRHIERAFDGYEHLTCYALKANSNKDLLALIAREGLGADVASKGEIRLALSAGFSPTTVTYSGVGKRDDEIRYALHHGIWAFNVESREEIDVLNSIAGSMNANARILLRVNLDIDAGGHRYVSTSLRQNKFGIASQHSVDLLRWAQGLPNIAVRGIHSHIGSQITSADTYVAAAKTLLALVKDLRAANVPITDLDFGGGFGVQYKGYIQHPEIPAEEPEALNLSAASLVRTVLPHLKETGCRLSIQPGRSIVAHAGVLITQVLYRKVTEEKVFLVVDGGMNDLLRPSLYQSHHQIVPLSLNGTEQEIVDVVGPLCETGDFFALDRALPRVDRGDYLAVMCAGAYGYVLSSNYNARPRPAEILIEGTSSRMIRERESFDQL